MKTLALVLAFAALAASQKPLKAGKHKPQYIASSPGGGGPESAHAPPQYQSGGGHGHQGSISNHGGFGGGHGHSPSYSSGIGKPGSGKATYPLLLSDTRTLNTDGTINFNYQADNGLQQGETVDADGTRRGFYSYPGADGKLITVKYTAGKNGFVAEGDHLPTQPQSAPYDPKQESHDHYSSGKQGSHHGSGLGSLGSLGGGRGNYHHAAAAPQHHGGHHGGHGGAGAYRQAGHGGHGGHGQHANVYSHSSLGGGHGHSSGGGSAAFANFPDFSSQFSSGFGGGSPSYSSGGGAGAGRYSGAGGHGHHVSGHPGGSQSFASLQGLGSSGHGGGSSHGSNLDLGSLGSQLGQAYSGPMFTASNPYQPASTAPVNAGFDLGNGGHFSINFTPGAGTEYNPNELSGDYSSAGQQGGAGGAGGHGGAQGRY